MALSCLAQDLLRGEVSHIPKMYDFYFIYLSMNLFPQLYSVFFRVNVNWPIGVNGVYVLFTFLCFVCSVPESESQFSPDPCAGLTLSPSSDSGLVSVQKFFSFFHLLSHI